MLVKKLSILFLKAFILVMLPLRLDIVAHVGKVRPANCESAVSILPSKPSHPWKRIVYPFGRLALQQLDDKTGCNRWRRPDERVDMVVDAADLKRSHLVVLRDSTDVRKDPIFYLPLDPGLSILCAK